MSEWATSADGSATHWTWDCTAGRFRWYFDLDETMVVVDGGVVLQVGEEPPVTLGTGDAAFFRAGTWVTWTVPEYVRKHAVLRVPVPRPMAYAVRGFGRRTHRLRG